MTQCAVWTSLRQEAIMSLEASQKRKQGCYWHDFNHDRQLAKLNYVKKENEREWQ